MQGIRGQPSPQRTALVRAGAAIAPKGGLWPHDCPGIVLVFSRRLRYQSAMMKKETIDQLAGRLAAALPQGVRSMRDDLENNFRSILQSGLARLDLVTREEFEIQESVLARTRTKLNGLEERMQSLESAPTPAEPPASDKSVTPAAKVPKKKAKAKKASARKAAGKKSSTKKASRKKAAAKKDG